MPAENACMRLQGVIRIFCIKLQQLIVIHTAPAYVRYMLLYALSGA
jgi:hypothetical protein